MAHLDHQALPLAGTPTYAPFPAGTDWPPQALQAFTLLMAGHGHCVSGSMMLGDRLYALEQLSHAHTMADEELRLLAMSLFRYFEHQRSGLSYTN